MGLNAYFTYSVVKGLGVPWETALGAVFLSGVAFLILTAVGVRQMIVSAIPETCLYGISTCHADTSGSWCTIATASTLGHSARPRG